jgi:hypothetical protein
MTFDTRNSVNDVGFLSPDLVPLIGTIRKENAVWFRLAEDINRSGQDILAAFKPSRSVPVRDVVGVALLIRSLSSYQGALLMAERGMIVEARTLVRCCFENAFVIGTLLKEGDAFLTELNTGHEFSRRAQAKWLLQKPGRLSAAPVGATRRLEQRRAEIGGKIGSFSPADFKALAKRANLEESYLIYSLLSGDAAHPSAQAIDRYLVRGNRRTPLKSMVWGAFCDAEHLPETLNFACQAMIAIGVAMSDMLGNVEANRAMAAHADVYAKLNDIKAS